MPDSEDKPIETLLRSAAARRRAEAGSPEMHPATRETLLTEVRRHYGQHPGPAPARRPWWWRFTPALAAVAVLTVGSWILFRGYLSAPVELAKQEAPAERRDRGTLAWPDAQPALAQAPAVESFSRETEGVAPTAALEESKAKSASPVLAYTPSASDARYFARNEPGLAGSEPAHAARLNEAASERASGASGIVNGLSAAKADHLAVEPTTAAMDGVMPAGGKGAMMEADAARAPQPTAALGAVQKLPAHAAPATVVPVLQNFVVVNAGRRVRFIDADGSTYDGDLQPVAEKRSAPPTSAASSDRLVVVESKDARGAQLAAKPEAQVTTVSYDFEAQGTNRSLQQQVRFAGNLVLTEQQLQLGRNAFSNTLLPELQRAQQATPPSQPSEPVGRVQGSLQLGDGSNLRVDAVSTMPSK